MSEMLQATRASQIRPTLGRICALCGSLSAGLYQRFSYAHALDRVSSLLSD